LRPAVLQEEPPATPAGGKRGTLPVPDP